MSELVAKSSGEIRARNALLGYWWYEKYEADKVIEELENKLDIYKRGFKEDDKTIVYLCTQLRHHKYKRCLAMAAKYLWERNYWRDSTPGYERQHQWENMAYKHYKRWLELAEKFKPNKEAE